MFMCLLFLSGSVRTVNPFDSLGDARLRQPNQRLRRKSKREYLLFHVVCSSSGRERADATPDVSALRRQSRSRNLDGVRDQVLSRERHRKRWRQFL
jgi:hypothetical protein